MSWKHALIAVGCAIALLAAFIRFSPSLLHPYGPNEVAIWNQILKREELAIADPADVRVVRWFRKSATGDLAPVHTVIVRSGAKQFKIDATAVKYLGEDWQARILSVTEQ